jgi:hypothetical protein
MLHKTITNALSEIQNAANQNAANQNATNQNSAPLQQQN